MAASSRRFEPTICQSLQPVEGNHSYKVESFAGDIGNLKNWTYSKSKRLPSGIKGKQKKTDLSVPNEVESSTAVSTDFTKTGVFLSKRRQDKEVTTVKIELTGIRDFLES